MPEFRRVGVFRSTGIPCAIGILVVMLVSLTLTPALITLAGRRGWLEPRPSVSRGAGGVSGWVWRVGPHRSWPSVGRSSSCCAAADRVACRLEPARGHAGTAESKRGYQAADRHFPTNNLLPAVVTVSADHDIRNPAG